MPKLFLTIMLYELRDVSRGWLFRIYAVAVTTIAIFMIFLFFSKSGPVQHAFYAYAASIPYALLYLLNISQTLIILIMTTDILKRDRKMDTAEVVYIRPVCNATYLFAKVAGVIAAFFILNLFLISVGATIHLSYSEIPWNPWPYLLYPFLLVMPTHVFAAGFSLLTMQVLRNQAVTVIIVLGYLILCTFYLQDRFYYLLDAAAFYTPLLYSSFVGIPDFSVILAQRFLYFFTGITALLLTVAIFHRLPQYRWTPAIMLLSAIATASAAGWCGNFYVKFWTTGADLRERMRIVNQTEVQRLQFRAVDLAIQHHARQISASAKILASNPQPSSLSRFFFSLNSGLQIDSIVVNKAPALFSRETHLTEVQLQQPLPAGGEMHVEVFYHGNIDHRGIFFDAPESQFQPFYRNWIYHIGRAAAFVEEDYLLLSGECLWYPVSGLPVGANFPKQYQRDFSDYRLTVKTAPALTVISQGARTANADGSYSFALEQPLMQLSLIAGPYSERSIQIDSLNISLYHHRSHDQFVPYFENIGDTLVPVLQEAKQDYQRIIGLSYPFQHFTIVEVPFQFYALPNLRSESTAHHQPQQLWVPENGSLLANFDLRGLKKNFERNQNRNNQSSSDKELAVDILKRVIYGSFMGEPSRNRSFIGNISSYQPVLDIFPQFAAMANHVSADSIPLLQTAIESYVAGPARYAQENDAFRSGLTDAEAVSQALAKKTLAELLADDNIPFEIRRNSMILGGDYLFSRLAAQSEIGDFRQALLNRLQHNRFDKLDAGSLLNGLTGGTAQDAMGIARAWNELRGLPGFGIENNRYYKVVDGGRIRYQIVFELSNQSRFSGIVELYFDYRNQNSNNNSDAIERPERVINVEPGQRLEVGIVLDTEPTQLKVDTRLSQNLPLNFQRRLEKPELRRRAIPFDGVRIPAGPPPEEKDEFIVDNEDEGFTTQNPPYASWLKRYIQQDDSSHRTYDRFRTWNLPGRWQLAKNSGFYGRFVYSAYFIKPGKGEFPATWEIKLPESGIYEVYVHAFQRDRLLRHWQLRYWERNDLWGDYTYRIYHNDGIEEVKFDVNVAEPGWRSLGQFSFEKGPARIELLNQTDGRLVIADAVRMVRRR